MRKVSPDDQPSAVYMHRTESFSRYYRYFETDHALRSHWKSKVHKRRCKALKEPAYTIEESERAAGLVREGRRPTTTTADTPMEQGMTP